MGTQKSMGTKARMAQSGDSISDASDKKSALATQRAVWTRHWATGASHSCVGSYGDLYGGGIAAFWRTIFQSLQHGQRVLDLATGNGALPRLLLDVRPEKACTVDAVDLATIEPAWVASLHPTIRAQVRFCSGHPLEALPYADGAFDLIVSQYGIEYSDLDRSVPEMLRVLAPDGCIALVMHIVGSRPVELAKIELGHLDWLVSDAGLLSATAGLIEPMTRTSTASGRASLVNDAAAEAARLRFNDAQDALQARSMVADGADVLFEVQNCVPSVLELAAKRGATPAREHLSRVEASIRDSRLRLEQLVRHALSQASWQSVCNALGHALGADYEVAQSVVHDQGYLMACTLIARPRSKTRL
jgi:SAM-dependent methyltransferase